MSLHFYPHEDLEIAAKRTTPPEGWGPHGSNIAPIAIINLTLLMSVLSFATSGNARWALIMFYIAAVIDVSLLPRRR
jgi:hypothetical protein